MFKVVEMKDTVRMRPAMFGNLIRESVEHQLNENYAGHIVPRVGMALFVEHLHTVSDVLFVHGDECGYVTAYFSIVVFSPDEGTVMNATISGQTKEYGIQLSLGFFGDIYVTPQFLPDGAEFDEKELVWRLSRDGGESYLYYELLDKCRIKVLGCTYNNTDTMEKAKEAIQRLMHPTRDEAGEDQDDQESNMKIFASMKEDLLGPTGWTWEQI